MNTEKSHDRFNAIYFTFAAFSFVALLSSVWWGGIKFLYASPLIPVLTLLGIGYIVVAWFSVKHAFCGPFSWMGCSCRGKSHHNPIRTVAMLIPIPVFAYFLYGTMIKATFDDTERSFDNVKTQMEIDRSLFGNMRAEGLAWRFAKRAFKENHVIMGDRISLLIANDMVKRHADRDELCHFLRKHSRYDSNDSCMLNRWAECESHQEGNNLAPAAVIYFDAR